MMHAALGIWVLSAVVCVGRSHHHLGHDGDAQNTMADGSVSSSSLVTSANKDFAFRLYRKLAAHANSQGKNIFYSPDSISVALAALSVGARGETHRQLFSGLGFNSTQLTQSDVNQAFRTLLGAASNTSPEDIDEGTAVFVSNVFKPLPEFLDTLKQSYLAEGFNVDFTNTAESVKTINDYVSDKTKGKIDKLVDTLNEDTVMFLLSYIYYKGKWATPFDPKQTSDDTFNVDENTKVPVKMMHKETRFDVYYDQPINTSVLHLPFNSSYSMLLLLPGDMAALESAIDPGHVTKWLRWMKPRTYEVYVPKFSIKSSYELKSVLADMGMTDMFGERADLSGISVGQRLTVSEVVHQATLDVDESGATATAATGVIITLMSLRHTPVLKFDRPFMVMILDRTTEKILFMGKIINPTI